MNYKEAKKKGFKYITRDIIGGECAHKEVPVSNNGYWYSKGWHYITKNGHVCKSKEDIMDIDTTIVLSRTKRPIEEIAIAEGTWYLSNRVLYVIQFLKLHGTTRFIVVTHVQSGRITKEFH